VELLVAGVKRPLPYTDIEHAAVEVEFNHPPASEIQALQGTDTTPEASK